MKKLLVSLLLLIALFTLVGALSGEPYTDDRDTESSISISSSKN